MTTKIADDAAAIKARLDEIQRERMQAIMGVPIEPVEAPKDIDWGMVLSGRPFSVDAPD